MTGEEPLASRLTRTIHEHEGWAVLEEYGRSLKRRAMPRDLLRFHHACQVATVNEVPPGILALALRVTDDWEKRDHFGSLGIAARTLLAGLHEYGLHAPETIGLAPTHFDLLRDALRSWGFDELEILHATDVIPEAHALARHCHRFFRHDPVPSAIGAHMALEVTADREWYLCWEGFSLHWEAYGLKGPDDPALRFYHIHTEQEPEHVERSSEVVDAYVAANPDNEGLILAGVTQYMAVYLDWIRAIHRIVA